MDYFIALLVAVIIIAIIVLVLVSKNKKARDLTPKPMDLESWVDKSRLNESQPTEVPDLSAEEIIAVITAAVSAHLGKHESQIRVKSFRRISQVSPAWNTMGRLENVWDKL